MDLSLLSQSISALSDIRDCHLELSSVKSQLAEMKKDFSNYKEKVRLYISSYISKTTALLASKQVLIESLQMVTPIQQNSELLAALSKYQQNSSISHPSSKLSKIVSSTVWPVVKSFLNLEDFCQLISIKSIRQVLFVDPSFPDHLSVLAKPSLVCQESSLVPDYGAEMTALINKCINQQISTGKNLEKKLTDSMPTLIRLYKSAGRTMPNQKFNSIAELIQNVFPYNILIEIFNKTTAAFSKKTDSMNEWLNFMQTLLASLISESSLLFIDFSEVFRLKDYLLERLKTVEDRLSTSEKSSKDSQKKLEKLSQINEEIVKRLHYYEVIINDKNKELGNSQKIIEKLKKDLDGRAGTGFRKNDEFSGSNQMTELRVQVEQLSKEKRRLLEVFNNLEEVLKSYNKNN